MVKADWQYAEHDALDYNRANHNKSVSARPVIDTDAKRNVCSVCGETPDKTDNAWVHLCEATDTVCYWPR